MTRLANRTSRRHDEACARDTFNRAAAFHAISAQLAELALLAALLFFRAPALAYRFVA
jgi:hypothetical protein